MDIVRYLTEKDCIVKVANDNNISTHCFFCGEEQDKRGRLYINVAPESEPYGLFFCHLCGTKGTVNKILAHFGDKPVQTASEKVDSDALPDDLYCDIFTAAAQFYHENLFTNPEAYYYLTRDRGLTEKTIKKFQLGWASGGLVTHMVQQGFSIDEVQATSLVDRFGSDFFVNRITIPYIVSGQVVDIRGKEIGAKYRTLPGGVPRLFNTDCLLPQETTSSVASSVLEPELQDLVSAPTHEGETETKTQPMTVSALHGAVTAVSDELTDISSLSVPQPPASDAVRSATVIAEGEFDTMTLDQLGIKAVGVPGAQAWKDSWSFYLSDSKRVYICFDNDTAGNTAAEKLATKLGPKARIAEMPKALAGQKKIDINCWMADYGKIAEDFYALFTKAKGGMLVTVFEAYQQWEEFENNIDAGLKFNIDTLDGQLRHGLMPAQVAVMLAKTNAGKTMMMINMFERMALIKPDIKILFFSLEQTRNEWFERAHRIRTFYDPHATLKDTVEYWTPKLMIVDKNRITRDQLAGCIEQFEFEMGERPHTCGLDYIGYYAQGYPGEEYARVSRAMTDLKEIGKDYLVSILTASQANRTGNFGEELSADQARGSGVLEETADMILSLVNPDQKKGLDPKDQSRELQLRILKSRDGAIGHISKMQFAPLSLAIVPISDPLYPKALKERLYAQAGDTWEETLDRHRKGGDDRIYLR